MRKLFILAAMAAAVLVLAVSAGISSRSAGASSPVTLWQIGQFDGAVDPIAGSSEYPATDSFSPTFNYTASGMDLTPNFPGVISDQKLSDVLPPSDPRPLTDAAETVTIQFSVPFCDYGTATLYYDRYGSEADELSLDGTVFDTVSGVEGQFQSFMFNLGPISAGSHQLNIVYKDGGSNNGHYIDALRLDVSDPTLCTVDIDIKPGSDPNCINPDSNGVIPVAILTTEDFDATTVDPATVQLEGAGVAVKGKSDKLLAAIEDVDGDGDLDLVVKIVDNTLQAGSTTATLTGLTFDGTPIEGTDFICIVPPKSDS